MNNIKEQTCGFGSSYTSFFLNNSTGNNPSVTDGPYSLKNTKSCLDTGYSPNYKEYTAFGALKKNKFTLKRVNTDIKYLT
jgi:hypothetical protein